MRLLLIFVLQLLLTSLAWGKCLPTPGPKQIKIKVTACELVKLDKIFKPKSFVEKTFGNFNVKDADRQKKIIEKYRGAILYSRHNDQLSKFFLRSKDPMICKKYEEVKTWELTVDHACCDGDTNPPCYLGFSAYIVKSKK